MSNIRVRQTHESNWCDWGGHKMDMQRVWIVEPVSWICKPCIEGVLIKDHPWRKPERRRQEPDT